MKSQKREGLEVKWERRLGLEEGEFLQLLLASGVVGPANAGTIEEEELWRQLGRAYHLDNEQLRGFRDDN